MGWDHLGGPRCHLRDRLWYLIKILLGSYRANQDFYPIHQEGMKQVTAGNTEGYIPSKVQFSIYAPDGELIQDGIRYNIGERLTQS